MKLITFLSAILFVSSAVAKAQDPDERLLANALDRRTIIHKDTLILFYVAEEEKTIKIDPGKSYYWFTKDTIMTTTGGFGGRVLNGEFKAYYPGKSIWQSGQFGYGLKDGPWKTWLPNGTLQSVTYWKKGVEKSP